MDKFNTQYPYRISLTENYPALVVFEDGEIRGILQERKNERLSISETEQFIEMQQIIQMGE